VDEWTEFLQSGRTEESLRAENDTTVRRLRADAELEKKNIDTGAMEARAEISADSEKQLAALESSSNKHVTETKKALSGARAALTAHATQQKATLGAQLEEGLK